MLVLPSWPKGLRKEGVDCWAKELAPEAGLLRHRECGLSPAAFAYVYLNRLSRPAFQERLRPLAILSLKKPVTFLCACRSAAYCHEGILAQALEFCRLRREGPGDGHGSLS